MESVQYWLDFVVFEAPERCSLESVAYLMEYLSIVALLLPEVSDFEVGCLGGYYLSLCDCFSFVVPRGFSLAVRGFQSPISPFSVDVEHFPLSAARDCLSFDLNVLFLVVDAQEDATIFHLFLVGDVQEDAPFHLSLDLFLVDVQEANVQEAHVHNIQVEDNIQVENVQGADQGANIQGRGEGIQSIPLVSLGLEQEANSGRQASRLPAQLLGQMSLVPELVDHTLLPRGYRHKSFWFRRR